MKRTIAELLDELQHPQNEEQIAYLSHFANFKHFEEFKHKRGLGGWFARMIMFFTRKSMEAFVALSECKTADDIAAFIKTPHYKRIKNSEIGSKSSDLSKLEKLEKLEKLKKLNENSQ